MASNKYSDEEKERIVLAAAEHVASGKTLLTFCRQEGMPNRTTLSKWINSNETWTREMAEAKEQGVEVMVESTLALIRQEPPRDRMGRVDNGHVQWVRTKLDHCLKLASVWSNRYSPKRQIEHTGGISFQVVTGVPEEPKKIASTEHKVLDVQVGKAVEAAIKEESGNANS